MQFDTVVTVKKEIEKEAFLREALIQLARNTESPIDVVDADFGEVKESVKEVIVCSSHVESDYTASIGYDRQEEYWDKEKKYNSTTRQYEYINVKKTRIITDWHPYSGHIAGDATCAGPNGCQIGNLDIVSVLKSLRSDSLLIKGEAEVDMTSLELVKQECRAIVELGIKYPGDRQKNKESRATITVKKLSCHKLPYYEAEYTYKGKKYKVEGFACGKIQVAVQTPPNDIDIEAVAEKDTKKLKTCKTISWISFAATTVFSWVMFALGVYWTWFIPTLALVAAIIFHAQHNKKYRERVRSLKEDNIKLKHEELSRVLEKNGYAPLSSAEADYFDEKTGSSAFAASHKKKGFTGKAILCGLVTFVLIIASLIGGCMASNEKLHSPEQFTITVTGKTQEYDPNASHYINGCYYIHFEYEIEADEIGADWIQIKTYVTDKNGEELGYIKTEFDNMNLDAGGKKEYSTTLHDNQPEKNNNTFFLALYNGDFEDFTFKHEITGILFSDGENYSGNNDF